MKPVQNRFLLFNSPAMTSTILSTTSSKHQTLKYEIAVIGLVLFGTAFLTSYSLFSIDLRASVIIWLSAFAVFVTFVHGAMSFDISEASSDRRSSFSMGFYWVSKEFLWLTVFLLSGAYPAIVGTVLFILYPLWRKCSLRSN